MARKKVKLAWIANDSARRATFKKRKKGLMKKVSELSTLCGVNACAIVYGPYDPLPDVWPPASSSSSFDVIDHQVHRVLARFKSLPDMEQNKKMMNQEGFMRQRITKLRDQLKRLQKDNREKEITHLMYQSLAAADSSTTINNNINIEDLSDLGWLLEEKIKCIQERIEVLNKNKQQVVMMSTTDHYAPHHHAQLGGVRLLDHHHHVEHQKIIRNTTFNNNNNIRHDHEHHEYSDPHHHYYDHHQDNKMMIGSLDVAMEDLKRQPWFMEMMNVPSSSSLLHINHDVVGTASALSSSASSSSEQQQQQQHMGYAGGGGTGEVQYHHHHHHHHESSMLMMPSFYGDNLNSSV